MSTKIGRNEVFFAQNRFPWPNDQLLPIHTIHILKAIVPAVNLAYLGTLYVHPVTRQIFFLHRGSEVAPLTVTCYEKKATKVVVQSET